MSSQSEALRTCAAALLLQATFCAAADQPGAGGLDQDPTPAVESRSGVLAQAESGIDSTRRRIEQILGRSSLWMDSLISDDSSTRVARKPYGSVELSDTWSQFYGNKPRLRFDARIDLPNTEHRLSGFIGRNNEDDFVRDRLDNSSLRGRFPRVDSQDQWLAGLGYSLPNNHVLQTDIRAGVRRLNNPEAFVQGRLRYNAYSDDLNLVHLRATPFWTTHEGFVFTVGADYSHVPNERLLLRWGNTGTVSENRQGLDWRSTLTLYQAVHERAGLAYELFIRGVTGDDVPLHEYGVQTTFRHPFLSRRLYGEWVAGYSFPRELPSDHRQGSIQLGLGIEMPFGNND